MESKSVDKTKFPPIDTVSKKGSIKSNEAKSPKNASSSSKSKPALTKDMSAAHPFLIGVDAQSLHPYYSELIDGLYKRPLVVSILIPKKPKKTFKYESIKREMSLQDDLFSSEDDVNEGNQSPKRARTPDRPSSRQAPKSEKKAKLLKVFIIKVYDLVESKEAIYVVVVRDFDKLLEELIIEENSMAVCDYFQPQSLEWWTRSLRHVLIAYDKPNEELSVTVDKKLIRKMVVYNMQHHVWMQQNLTPEQVRQQKIQRAASRKKRQRAHSRPTPVDATPSLASVPWNDYVALGERNAGASFRGPAGLSSSGKSTAESSSRKLPPVSSSSKTPPTQNFAVGDWVEGNFKRGGQWFPGIVKKAHREPAGYFDIDYDDGRAEEMVEAKLLRAAGSAKKKKKKRSSKQADSLDLLSGGDTDGFEGQPSTAYPEDPSTYDYGDAFSPGTTGGGYDSSYSQETGYDVNASQSYGTDAQWPETSQGLTQDSSMEGYDSSQYAYDQSGISYAEAEAPSTTEHQNPPADHPYANEVLENSDYHTEDAGASDYNSHAYDYTNQAVIEEDANTAAAAAASSAQPEPGYESEIAESAELIAREVNLSRPVTVSAYVDDLISNVLAMVCPAPAEEAAEEAAEEPVLEVDGPVQESEPPAQVDEETSAETALTYDEQAPPAFEDTVTTGGEGRVEAQEEVAQQSEVTDFIAKEFVDPNAQQSPTKMALQSLMQVLSLEDSSREDSVINKKAPKKVTKKRGSAKAGKAVPAQQLESSASAMVLLGNSESESEQPARGSTAEGKVKKTKKGKAGSKSKSEPLPVEAVDVSRANTSSGFKPPRMEDYVSPVIPRSSSPPRVRTSQSRKKKAKKPTPEKATALAVLEAAEMHHASVHAEPATIAALLPPLMKRSPSRTRLQTDDDDISVGSHHSHTSHHKGVDSHGNFDHSDLPHYNPHVTREEAAKAAIQAIIKPHSTVTDRYAYVMMPAPLHLSQPVHHHYGHGPKHDHPHDHTAGHGHGHGHGHSHEHPHSGEHHDGHAHQNGHGHHDGTHNGHHDGEHHLASIVEGHTHHPHHGDGHHAHQSHHPHQDAHIAHHDRPFEVSTNLDRTHLHQYLSNCEPDPMSETMHSTHYPSIFDVPADLAASVSSLPPLKRQHSNPTVTRPNTDLVTESGTVTTSSTALVVAGSESGHNRPTSKSKARDTSPFRNKNQYKGPQRRVIDIIEWARISVGGSPKKQKRKISAVEQRLLGSPLALKLIIDKPLDVPGLIENIGHKQK